MSDTPDATHESAPLTLDEVDRLIHVSESEILEQVSRESPLLVRAISLGMQNEKLKSVVVQQTAALSLAEAEAAKGHEAMEREAAREASEQE